VTNSGTPFTIDLTAYQDKNVVISAVTKYNDGTGDFYSPITTATYTYAGVITPMMQLSNMSLQAGNWDIIIPVITDHQGNPLTFGQDADADIDYNDYFTFTYVKNDGGAATITVDATGKVTAADEATAGQTATITVTASAIP